MKSSNRYSLLTALVILCLGVAVSASILRLPAFRQSAAPAQAQLAPAAGDSDAGDDTANAYRSAFVQTDKADYAPGEVIVITGGGWDPGEAVTLLLHEEPTIHPDRRVTVIADASGNIFDNQFTQDAHDRGVMLQLTARGRNTGLSTQAAFGNPSANLDQWANLSPPSWVNGNLGSSKAEYFEGDSIPYRLRFDNLNFTTSPSHTVTIEWDTTKSSKHALDYLTTFDASWPVSPPRANPPNPCLGVTPCADSLFAIPKDGQVDNGSGIPVAQAPGDFTIYGGTITSVGVSPYYSYPNGTGFTGDKSARISITFTATQKNPVLAWGGRIATRKDWGSGNSAVAIPGSPYHTRLIDLDGSGGNQDRSLSAAAVIFPGSIKIVKDAVPNDQQSFGFSTTTGAALDPATFSLVDNGGINYKLYANILNFTTYKIAETPVTHWTLSFSNPPCTVSTPNGGSSSASGSTVTINMQEGEDYTCTFTNTHDVNTPSITTTLVPLGPIAIGAPVHDTATLHNQTSDAGGTVTYKAYAGADTCSGTALFSETVTVTNGNVPASGNTSFATTGTYSWQATYSGDTNNTGPVSSGCSTEQLVVSPNTPSITTTLVPLGPIAIGAPVHDTATLHNQTSDAGGTVTYKAYAGADTCSGTALFSETVTVTNGNVPASGNTSFATTGTYSWQATYSGDTNNTGPVSSGCSTEQLVVSPNTPSITTTLVPLGPIAIGAPVHDTATLHNQTSDAGGTVTYKAYAGADTCSGTALFSETVTVTNGNVPASGNTSFATTGTYSWQATYSGDTNNTGPVSSGCSTEQLVVSPNTPSITTTLVPLGPIAIGAPVHDTATLHNQTSDAGGTVTYKAYAGADTCSGTALFSETVTVTNGNVPASGNTSFATAGTYSWQATYSGDANNTGPVSSDCSTEQLVVGKNPSGISTTPDLIPNDSATLTGLTSNAGGTITFNLFSPNHGTCSGTAAHTETVDVSGNVVTTYSTSNTTFKASTEGTWRWQVIYSGDANNEGSTSVCGVEKFSIGDPTSALAVQLLAAHLNWAAGNEACQAALTAINDARELLAAIHFDGATHDVMTAAQNTQAIDLSLRLERYNKNELCK